MLVAVALSALAGCSHEPAVPVAPRPLTFAPVPVPVADADRRGVIASSVVRAGARDYPIAFYTLFRSGDTIRGVTTGAIVDANGQPLTSGGTALVSDYPDFSSLLSVGTRLFMVTHYERIPGAMYLSELQQRPQDGRLSVVYSRHIDFAAWGGIYNPCAGSVTPWGTHLGGEEFEPDARVFVEASDADLDNRNGRLRLFKNMTRYYGKEPTDIATVRATLNPYRYGWPVEVTVAEDGTTTVRKHYAMGRRSLEMAYVMPDRRTVYLSDDGANVGLYMFVADRPDVLEAGTLYAARWHQHTSANGGAAALTWMDLGHAGAAEVRNVIEAGGLFTELFNYTAPDAAGRCPQGYGVAVTSSGRECLAVKRGMELAASRLETRRYAALRGATTEFNKGEGLTFDPQSRTLFVAMSSIEAGMESYDAAPSANAPSDHIQLARNACGAVYALALGSDAVIGSDYVARDMRAALVGHPKEYAANSPYTGNRCDVEAIANPDNLTFIPPATLIVGEDSGEGHQNDALWSFDTQARNAPVRILTAPYGAEVTSPYLFTGIKGYSYLMTVVQHPYGESDQDKARDPSDVRAYVGYIGPLPQ